MSAIQNDRAQRPPRTEHQAAHVSPEARAEIEAVLSTFRQWLLECSHLHQELTTAPAPAVDSTEAAFDTTLHGLLSEWLALREQLRRDSGDGRSAREDLTKAIEAFREGSATLQGSSAKLVDGSTKLQDSCTKLEDSGAKIKVTVSNALTPLVKDRDRLRDDLRNRLQIQQHNWLELILDVRTGLAEAAGAARGSLEHLGWRRRLVPGTVKSGVGDGFDTALERIDSALDSRGVNRTAAVGEAVDTQTMKVVGTVDSDDFPPGHVVEVVKHGYTCGNEVVRFAEVKSTLSSARNPE